MTWTTVAGRNGEPPGSVPPAGASGEPGAPAYPAELERQSRTRAGVLVRVRPIRPGDGPGLVAFHAGLSAHTVYLRFFGFHPVLAPAEVERFTHVDYADRLALVVEDGTRIVGVGRYDRIPGSDDAEVAFIVHDNYQHQGLGTLLADELVRAARTKGVTSFVADTLAENGEMLELFHSMGFPVHSSFEGGVVRVRFPIADVPPYAAAVARREAWRSGEDTRRC